MSTIRAFIAIHLPDDVKRSLTQVSHALAVQVPGSAVRWVKPDRIHLTLRFLGDTDVSKLAAIATGLDHVGSGRSPFTLSLERLGCFPNQQRPRVIWVGLQGQTDALSDLKRDVDQVLEPLGWEPEHRPFQAHLTLGRVKDQRGIDGIEWGARVSSSDIQVSTIHLIESQLRPAGPVYTVRHTSSLGST